MSNAAVHPRSRLQATACRLQPAPEVLQCAIAARSAGCAGSNARLQPATSYRRLCSRKTEVANSTTLKSHRSNPANNQDADKLRNNSIDQKTRPGLREP